MDPHRTPRAKSSRASFHAKIPSGRNSMKKSIAAGDEGDERRDVNDSPRKKRYVGIGLTIPSQSIHSHHPYTALTV